MLDTILLITLFVIVNAIFFVIAWKQAPDEQDLSDEEREALAPQLLATGILHVPGLGREPHDERPRAARGDREAQAQLRHDFGPLNVRTTIRAMVERDQFEYARAAGTDFFVFDVPRLNATANRTSLSEEWQIRALGFLWDTAFDYDGKYVVTVLGRRDGSSLFGEEQRWQNYYRLSAAWRMSHEPWFPFHWMTEFKPRYSIGTSGGRPSFDAQYQTYQVSAGSIVPRTLGNSNLKPELATEQEFGLDAVIAERLQIQANYVKTKVEDQLLLVPLPSIAGFTSQWQNAATVSSTTRELALQASIIERQNLLWTARLNLDNTRNRITHLGVAPYRISDYRAGLYIREGETLGSFYGWRYPTSCERDLPAALGDRVEACVRGDRVQPRLERPRVAVAFHPDGEEHFLEELFALVPVAGVQQPDYEVGILQPPPGEAFVEPVHRHEIAAPGRQVAGPRAAPAPGPRLAEGAVGQGDEGPEAVHPSGEPRAQPSPSAPGVDRKALAQHALGEPGAERHAVAGEKMARLGEAPVPGDEIARRNAVAVGEDHVVGARRGERAVADRRSSEAAVLLPDVPERERRSPRPGLDQLARLVGRAVIGDDHLEIAVALRGVAVQHRRQRVGAVVGGDDNRGAHCSAQRRSDFSASSMSLR